MNEGVGDYLYDASGRGHTVELFNDPDWIGSTWGHALNLVAATEHHGRADSILNYISSDTQGSIVTVFDFVNGGINQMIFTFADTSANSFIGMYINTADKLVGQVRNSGTNQWNLFADTPLTYGPHIAVLAQDGVEAKLYVDGILVAQNFSVSNDITQWVSDIAGLDNCRIGSYSICGSGDALFFNNSISAAYYYNRALSQKEVSYLAFDPFSMFRHMVPIDDMIDNDVLGDSSFQYIPHAPELRSRRPWSGGAKWGLDLPTGNIVNKYDRDFK